MRFLLAVTVSALALALPTGAQAATQSFGSTGGPQAWKVPAGVTSASFDLSGAQGGARPPLRWPEPRPAAGRDREIQ